MVAREAGHTPSEMASSILRLCHRVKQIVPLLQTTSGRRTLVDSSLSIGGSPEFLLQEIDLPKPDPDFLRVVSKQHFIKKFGEKQPLLKVYSPVEKSLRRVVMIFPLHVKEDNIIPIPFIIDTGAPHFAYLGTGAVLMLRDAMAIVENVGSHPFRLQGRLCRGNLCIQNPPVSLLPLHYEELAVRGDPRLNLLGLPALELLNVFSFD